MKNLKPVVFISGKYNHNRQNTTQQVLLLKALRITQNPLELKKMIHVRTVAEVFRTLDKMALRKEYHEALGRNGLNFDAILGVLKSEMEGGEKSGDRIKAAQIILKSLGMDKYEDSSVGGGSWEDRIMEAQEKEMGALPAGEIHDVYEVKKPKIPDSVKKQRAEEAQSMKSLYE